MTYANLWTYECPIFAETEMNQHFGDNGQLCRSLHKNMTPYTPAEHQQQASSSNRSRASSSMHQQQASSSS
jgi:hypothetical protein